MLNPKQARRCGSCLWWGSEEAEPGVRQCQWPAPLDIPFWASISEWGDHQDWTRANDGKKCPAWVTPEPQEPR